MTKSTFKSDNKDENNYGPGRINTNRTLSNRSNRTQLESLTSFNKTTADVVDVGTVVWTTMQNTQPRCRQRRLDGSCCFYQKA